MKKSNDSNTLVPVKNQDYTIVETQDGRETALLQQPVEIEENHFLNYLDRLDAIDKLSPKVSLNAAYREFNTPGETVRAIFTGMSEISKKDDNTGELKLIEVGMWMEKSAETGVKQLFMNGGIALIGSLQTLAVGTPIEITYKGKKDRTKLFDVILLS